MTSRTDSESRKNDEAIKDKERIKNCSRIKATTKMRQIRAAEDLGLGPGPQFSSLL